MKEVKAKSYTLRTENGQWLGQIVLTNDGMFASVTDWGNLSYAWRAYGDDFREFLCSLNPSYFGSKLYTGMAYILFGKKCEQACDRFAEKILPALQKVLREEIQAGIPFCETDSEAVILVHEAAKLVGNPGMNISGSTDLACMDWRESFEKWIETSK